MEGRMKATKWMALAAVAVLASACGGDGDGTGPGDGGANGNFSAEVTGDVETSFSGYAYHGEGEDEQGNQGYGIVLSEVEAGNENGGVLTFVRIGSSSLPAGDYTVKDPSAELQDGDVVALAPDTDGNALVAMFASTGGTLHISSSSGSQIKGTFDFDATGVVFADPETELNVTVAGSFTTKSLPQGAVQGAVRKLRQVH
jgi:hypothetical protein